LGDRAKFPRRTREQADAPVPQAEETRVVHRSAATAAPTGTSDAVTNQTPPTIGEGIVNANWNAISEHMKAANDNAAPRVHGFGVAILLCTGAWAAIIFCVSNLIA
jgi:hypothetical protein